MSLGFLASARKMSERQSRREGGLLIFSHRTEQPTPEQRSSNGTNNLAANKQRHAAWGNSSESVGHPHGQMSRQDSQTM
jgi:hypothetical protein